MPAFRNEAEFQRWLERNPAARLRLATADGTAVPEKPAPAAPEVPAQRRENPRVVPSPVPAWLRRLRVRRADLDLWTARLFAWFCLAAVGGGVLGLWTCLAMWAGHAYWPALVARH